MTSQASSASTPQAFELKGRMLTLTILRLLDADLERFLSELEGRIAEAPAFFDGMPVILDLAPVAATGIDDVWLSELAHHLWQGGLAPVAVMAGDSRVESAAQAAGLGVMRQPGSGTREVDAEPAKARAEPEPVATRLVIQPVRSGQQIYARGGDLVVLAAVSPGAEVLADGNIHVYGHLRGRALAGVQGDAGARIFCQQLDAELLAIAGCYRVSEDIDEDRRGHSVQVRLEGETLHIEPLTGAA